MFKSLLPRFVLAGGVLATVLSAPAESLAITNWFGCGGLFSRPGCVTTYRVAAPVVVNACSPCATACCPTQVCSYVPQTTYRAVAVNVPVTTYRPVTTCDPCTGCTVTCMRPVASVVRQTRYVPSTTYRLSCSTTCSPTNVYGVVANSITGLVNSAASCCTTGVPATTTPTQTPAPSLQVTPPAQPPAEQDIPATTPEQSASFRMRPVPDRNISTTPPADDDQASPANAPQKDSFARTAPSDWSYSAVTWQPRSAAPVSQQEKSQPATNDGGWRASTR